MGRSTLDSAPVRRAAAAAIGAYLRFALATTRWRIVGEEHLAPFRADTPVIFAFWHECLPLIPAAWLWLRRGHPGRRSAVLISRHRDGLLIAAVIARFSVQVVHGSSAKPGKQDKGGAAALRAMLARLRAAEAVVVTPDGPRGPPRVAAGGLAQLAALSGAPVVPLAARQAREYRLGTWDRMILPLPWRKGVIVCLPPVSVSRAEGEAATPRLAAALTEAALRAEALT